MDQFTFDDLENKCRCCFKLFRSKHYKIEILDEQKNAFYSLTQVELISDPMYPNFICIQCDMDLDKFTKFKTEASDRQQKLYEAFPTMMVAKEESIIVEEIQPHPEYEEIYIEEHVMDEDDKEMYIENMKIETYAFVPKSPKKKMSYTCDHCPKSFPSAAFKQRHMREWHTTAAVSCELEGCDLQFSNARLMKLHYSKYHVADSGSKLPLYYCDFCEYFINRKNSMAEHMKTHHMERNKVKCSICEYETFTEKCLKRHMQTHSSNRPVAECTECDFRTVSSQGLRAHMKRIHVEKYAIKCWKCEEFFSSDFTLAKHLELVHFDEKPAIPCPECPKKFFTEALLTAHLKSKHWTTFKCLKEDCDKMFYDKKQMTLHYKNVHIAKPIQEALCIVCGKSYSSMKNLKEHMRVHDENREKFKCQFCDAEFCKMYVLKCHLLRHTKPHPDLPCSVCDEMFYNDLELRHHEKSKHSNQRFVCEECGKSFKMKSYLKMHVESVHNSKEVPDIICDLCERAFFHIDQLRKHKLRFHPKKKYDCEFCELSFSMNSMLQTHIKTAHEGLRYHCVVPGCTSSYTFKQKLRKHLASHKLSKDENEEYLELIKDLKME